MCLIIDPFAQCNTKMYDTAQCNNFSFTARIFNILHSLLRKNMTGMKRKYFLFVLDEIDDKRKAKDQYRNSKNIIPKIK